MAARPGGARPTATRVNGAGAPVPAAGTARWRGVTGPPLPHIRSALRDGVLAVGLAGELDHYSCAPLRALLDEGAALGARRLVLDAAGVTFCDSALLDVLDRWGRGGRRWELAAASRSVRMLLELWDRVRVPPAPVSGPARPVRRPGRRATRPPGRRVPSAADRGWRPGP
ncbi:STAS domain-containing protein [Streptomyces sp. NPDC031705]|uniref:STAS domain-containing protein n=1 Tax=Streptomyces sp. NPDC031705 TaxID=3155729 RepID=UPI0033C59398